jgi:hypothetical protein
MEAIITTLIIIPTAIIISTIIRPQLVIGCPQPTQW